MRQLDRDEPDYAQAVRLGPEALPHLEQLIQGSNLGLAAKAACLAGTMNAEGSAPLLELAASHADPVVRVAAAAAARNLTHMTASLATTFLEDPDHGVRKWALRSLEVHQPQGIKERIQKIVTDDPDLGLREQARRLVEGIK
ncbi:HEAT repeat domain-containing protein [uncultured Paludibaculum sp.]|uniref:HEAT repeat domain-containing protein n=1 Tax=uncultured Paludibaculum sp. TaxID=1765020 RepID=UPI00374DD95E